MRFSRREMMVGLASLSACSPKRDIARDVFAAGQPAAILLLALAPDRLIGWPRRPRPEALALLPSADLPQMGALASGGAPANLETVAALNPRLIVDYGDVEPRYQAIAGRIGRRLDAPYELVDGALVSIPTAFIRAGALLNRRARAQALADRAAAVLQRWSSLQSSGPSFYYARGDGLETGFVGSLATEVLEGAGWRNVATGGRDIGRVSREQVAAWDPEVVVTLDKGFARRALESSVWAERRGGARRRILLMPELPFGWIDRPPSINRLLGCAWLSDERRGSAVAIELAGELWRVRPPSMATVAPRWIA